ncbi:Septin-domain-containing protein [Irpex rosettiformis]|uniref:Septin-domain-containing protein n=1 Tax=Irpex rosettiformis TaxID=378272 RepID=A0ACB8U0J7_9APHY|nr:Septin-domain-containing protein [Irpex rosettiformis]
MFGLSFRRKGSKKQQDRGGPPFIRQSPSLPELSAQGIPWPENLVDVSDLPPPVPEKPLTGKLSNPSGGPISSLYMPSHPPSAFDKRKSSTTRRPSHKRNRNPTTFNLMIVGGQGTGKTSLLRLLLETAEVSPTATAEQRANLERLLSGPTKRTNAIEASSIEICESKYDRLLFTVIDTPGLDFHDELRLDRQVSTVVKYMDEQFADTLREESKVVRQNKGDQHIHLCIYAIDPTSVASASRVPTSYTNKRRSDATIPQHSPGLSNGSTISSSDLSYDEPEDDLVLSPADIAVMRRLAQKVNLLPVISRADSLTDDKLAAIKKVVHRDLSAAGLDFGVFAPSNPANGPSDSSTPTPTDPAKGGEDDQEPEEERRSRSVIKLRPTRNPFKRFNSRSRSRLDLTENVDEPDTAEIMDNESVASVRFSAQIVAKKELTDLLPFALIAPEYNAKRRSRKMSRPISAQSFQTDTSVSVVTGAVPSEDGHIASSPTSTTSKLPPPFLNGPPPSLRGMFTRKFRWGTVDVLDPEHCDFAALRTAVLSTHMKMLKIRTKEVLYERYRTEKLLARRATQKISESDRRRIFEGAFDEKLLL